MKLEIKLDEPDRRYTGGDLVKGKVIIESKTKTEITGLLLVCIGSGSVRWTYKRRQPMNGQATTQTLVTSDKEIYFQQKQFLEGSEKGPTFEIPPSKQIEFPFSIKLPRWIPASYYSNSHLHYGKIEYCLEACIIQAGKIYTREKITFPVTGTLDLNDCSYAAQAPVDIQKETRLCCLCCTSGPVGFIFKPNKLGYIPGEKLEFAVDLYNKSRRDVTLVKAVFLQHHTLQTIGGQRYQHSHVVDQKVGQPLRPGQNLFWHDYFTIATNPPIPPTGLGGNCKLIKIWYNVKIEMRLKCAMALEGDTEIIIGTIPIANDDEGSGYYSGKSRKTPKKDSGVNSAVSRYN